MIKESRLFDPNVPLAECFRVKEFGPIETAILEAGVCWSDAQNLPQTQPEIHAVLADLLPDLKRKRVGLVKLNSGDMPAKEVIQSLMTIISGLSRAVTGLELKSAFSIWEENILTINNRRFILSSPQWPIPLSDSQFAAASLLVLANCPIGESLSKEIHQQKAVVLVITRKPTSLEPVPQIIIRPGQKEDEFLVIRKKHQTFSSGNFGPSFPESRQGLIILDIGRFPPSSETARSLT